MKRLYLIYGASALAATLIAAPLSVNAQENGNRDVSGGIVRGPYETNSIGDNWFVGIGGGINMLLNDGYDVKIGPSLDVNFGKWFTPSIGMRAGYQGLNFNSVKNGNTDKYGYMYIHGDFLWNISNALSGYKETRFWNFVPYLHAGFFRSFIGSGSDFADNEFAAGAGLLHNLRITDRLDAIIDMRATVVRGSVHGSSGPAVLPSVTAGVAYDLGWPNFVRTSTVLDAVETANAEKTAILEVAILALESANAALETENMNLKKKSNDLNKTVTILQKAEASYESDLIEMQPITVYFSIGQAVLGQLELEHLDFYARNIIEKVNSDPQVSIVVMGSADSNTGTARRNQYLSEERGKYIVNLLSDKYGIDADRVIVRSEVVKAKSNPDMERAVIISFN
ncbi:MAG: OmpA family protein [Bacteroidales bacterium]|nr:OmpA family protein [Bacteroidales bacterium]